MARGKVLQGKKYPLNMRVSHETRSMIEQAAVASGRSMLQEVEWRIQASFESEKRVAFLQRLVLKQQRAIDEAMKRFAARQ